VPVASVFVNTPRWTALSGWRKLRLRRTPFRALQRTGWFHGHAMSVLVGTNLPGPAVNWPLLAVGPWAEDSLFAESGRRTKLSYYCAGGCAVAGRPRHQGYISGLV